MEHAVTAKALNLLPGEEKRGMVGFGTYGDVMDALEQAVAGREFIAGDRFSAADLYLASQLGWGMGFGTVEKRPAFETYVAKHYARPAHRRATELDDALLTPEQRKMMGGA